MKVLIIGANGQLGEELCKELRKKSWIKLVTWSRHEMDLLYSELLYNNLFSLRPDIIVNAAAYTNVDKAEINKELAFIINYEAVKKITEYSKITKTLIVQFSTDYVFDGKNERRYKEYDNTNPLNIYGHSKLAADIYILKNAYNALIFRTSWIFSSKEKKFLKNILDVSKSNKIIRVVDDQYGSPLSAKAVAYISVNAMLALINRKVVNLYNISLNNTTSRYKLASLFITKIKNNSSIKIKCEKILSTKSFHFQGALRPRNSSLETNIEINKLVSILPNLNLDICLNETIEEIIKKENGH